MSGSLILVIVLVVLALLAVGGMLAQRRRLEARSDRFASDLDDANVELATAHAADRGWEPAALETAARDALREQRPDAAIRELTLVQVVDRPGADEDRAVFRSQQVDGTELLLTMARRDGAWYAERVEG